MFVLNRLQLATAHLLQQAWLLLLEAFMLELSPVLRSRREERILSSDLAETCVVPVVRRRCEAQNSRSSVGGVETMRGVP